MTPPSDPLMERFEAEEQHRKDHPWDWQYVLRCRECGAERIEPIHRSEIGKARQVYGLPPDAHVVITGYCKQHSGPDEPEEEA